MSTQAPSARRLFLALELPADARAGLLRLQDGLPGVRWSKADTLHLTLRFLGDVEAGGETRLRHELDGLSFSPFGLVIDHAGFFARGEQAVIWAAPAPSAALQTLHDSLDGILEATLGMARERRYTPHVTLGRTRRPDRDSLRAFAARHAGLCLPFTAARVTLFHSVLAPAGARHMPLGRYGGPPPP